ncbi:hypothetical protein CgunFtcFv8_006116 [Champsocephalus gunnari]|uniref:Uncharacterized protein n=1 Tax=Champsocephalus gunnari TaxID=52237 RepID=A0AAN8BZP3_CHAGU|nr:hypothetical protein CgunFtcFv8_006116 [Champsocephalus gunnari]
MRIRRTQKQVDDEAFGQHFNNHTFGNNKDTTAGVRFRLHQATLDTFAEMAEKRKTRGRSISDQPISSEQSSQMNEEESTAPSIAASDRSKEEIIFFSGGLKRSLSSESAAPSVAQSHRSMGQPLRFDVKKSSQMNEDESTAPSIAASDRSKEEIIYFSGGLKRSLSSESAAPSVAQSHRSMGQPLRFDVKKSSQMNEDESTAPSVSASDRSKEEIIFFGKGLKRELTEEPVRKKPKKDLEPQREADPGGSHLLKIQTNHRNEMLRSFAKTSEDEGRRRLIPAVRISRKAILADCKVTEEWVKHLSFGLKFPYSPLRDLDLSTNDLKDSGVKLLCDGLSNAGCRLERLSLSGCQVTEKGCTDLASALKSNPSHLIELDLSYNSLGDSGEKLMSELKQNTQYKLSRLHLEHGGSHRMIYGLKKYACELTLDPNTVHKNLLLSEGNRKQRVGLLGSFVSQLSPPLTLDTLREGGVSSSMCLNNVYRRKKKEKRMQPPCCCRSPCIPVRCLSPPRHIIPESRVSRLGCSCLDPPEPERNTGDGGMRGR